VKNKGALVGSHCCGNTDWSLMVEAGVDIINFDAYVYMDSVALYAESLSELLDRGGYLAWGIVPSQSLEARPSPEALLQMLRQGIELLSDRGVSRERLLTNLVLTTSCGLGTLTVAEAEAALRELETLQGLVRDRLAT
jgi:methionine synthase II (cobalamin-independent)